MNSIYSRHTNNFITQRGNAHIARDPSNPYSQKSSTFIPLVWTLHFFGSSEIQPQLQRFTFGGFLYSFTSLGPYNSYNHGNKIWVQAIVLSFVQFSWPSRSFHVPQPQPPPQCTSPCSIQPRILMLRTSPISFFLSRVQRKAPFADKPRRPHSLGHRHTLPKLGEPPQPVSSFNTRHRHVDKALLLLCWSWWLRL